MPLTYRDRGSSNTQLDVLCGTMIVARIGKRKAVPNGASIN